MLKCWKMGQTHSLQPRILHDCKCTVLLVAALYSCPFGHEVSSTDPRLMSQLPQEQIPFVLLHKTGFLKHFAASVLELVAQGMTFTHVERFVQNRRQQFVTSLLLQVQQLHHQGISTDGLQQSTAVKLLSEPAPSNDILNQCFLADFFENRDAYNLHMSLLPIKEFISLDHTFKVASNIGFLRSDGKWVTLYNSVFIAMNEHGQVVTWQFTSSTSLDEVKPQLETLQERMTLSCLPPFNIFVDTCCSQRNKLQEVFGEDATVKLDIFHAVQRITRKIPKRHPFSLECMNDLKMVYRSPTDIAKQRKQSTPCPAIIMERLEDFITKWHKCELHGWKVLNDAALNEISCLKVHIRKECLSDISPSAGTNRNEALHRHLNPHFANRSRIGLPLALALMTILLFQHNCRIEAKLTGKQSPTIQLWRCRHGVTNSSPTFGIQKKDVNTHEISWIATPLTHISSFNPKCLEQACLSYCISEDISDMISVEDIFKIMENAINLAKVAAAMQKHSSHSPSFNYKFLPQMSSVASLFFHHNAQAEAGEHAKSEGRLENLLKAWRMKRQCIEGDGNCSFSAVAFSLLTNASLISQHSPQFFSNLGIDPSNDLKSVSMKLRNLTVAEWRCNQHDYEGFLPDINIQQEAMKFMQSGYFFGELADTIVLALSNLLGLPFIVFTSSIYQPVITITPRHLKVPIPVYLAFNQSGAGHYDGVVVCDDERIQPLALPVTSNGADAGKGPCSCGKNDKTDTSHCHPVASKYTTITRCTCCKESKACTNLCKCKTCNNPFGKKLPTTESMQTSRKRPRHSWQHKISKSVKFALDAREHVSSGPRSILEFFILESITKYCIREGIETTPGNIEKTYNAIVEISDTLNKKLPIGTKSIDDVEVFLKEHDHIVEVFKALCLAQIENERDSN